MKKQRPKRGHTIPHSTPKRHRCVERWRGYGRQMNHGAKRAAQIGRLIGPMYMQQMRRSYQQYQQYGNYR